MAVRKRINTLAYSDPEFAEAMKHECARDPIFFVNIACWIREPRKTSEWQLQSKYGDSQMLPFITRPYQDEVIESSAPLLGKQDVIVWKSREMGVSLTYLALALWDLMFHEHTQIGLVSKDKLTADNADDPNSLMSMFEGMLKNVPKWLRGGYRRNQAKRTITFDNESCVTAYAATGDFVRGGRKAWILMDEFHFFAPGEDYAALDASVDATNCRVIVSTVDRTKGASGAFHSVVENPFHNGKLITLDWWQDIDKARGLYHSDRIGTSEQFKLVIDDAEFWETYKLEGDKHADPTDANKTYDFVLDGRKRSLYYDWRCRRPGASDASVEAELGRKWGIGQNQACDADAIELAISKAKTAVCNADVYWKKSRKKDEEDDWFLDFRVANGNTTFWCELKDGKPPPGEYSIGADISAGLGTSQSSYSSLEVFNRETGENVCEWRSNRVYTLDFAGLAVWFCKLFYNAYLVPEKNGSLGATFVKRVYELGYGNVYHHRVEGKAYKEITDYVGYTNSDGGRDLLLNLQDAIISGKAHVNSVLGLREMLKYIVDGDKITHVSSVNDEDPSSRGKAHGDAAIGLGCGWLGVSDRPAFKEEEKSAPVPENSFMGRRQKWLQGETRRTNPSYWCPTYPRESA